MTQPTRQQREWNQRHQEILTAAGSLFLNLGFSGTTVQMIADQAEFSVGYLYKHFPGKNELMIELIDLQLDRYEELRQQIQSDFAGNPLLMLRELVCQSCQMLQDQAHMLSLFLSQDSPGPERIRKRMQKMRREDAVLFRDAQDQGQIRPCDPTLMAAALDGAFSGLIRNFLKENQLDRLIEIPDNLEKLFFTPLTRGCSDRASGPDGKDQPTA